MIALLTAVLFASFIGSPHCGAMCGPLVALAVAQREGRPVMLSVLYHGGRLVTYMLLGAVAGAIGGLMDLAAGLAGLQPIALAFTGAVLVAFGVVELLRYRGAPVPRMNLPTWLMQALNSVRRAAFAWEAAPRALAIGLLTALLPCGWLYAFAITAAGTSEAWRGAAVMGVFWIGTVPILLAVGIGARKFLGSVGQYAPLISAMVLIAAGGMVIWQRMLLSPQQLIVAASLSTADHSEPNPHELPPCCQKK